ncbi:hypothetical protein HKCCE2091_16815 [Rhodobacterales bacterium HKCCE2091]|nr:hypothetical protein [Rhodobacterales bacterium HKCCE2091]
MAAPNRYSTWIAWAKIVLPLIALAILSTLFLFSGRPDPESALPIYEGAAELAREQRLGSPRFAGTLEDGREILFAAESAAPVPDTTDRFTAEVVSARLVLAPGLEALIDAPAADIDMVRDEATLDGGVELMRTDGLRLSTETLTLGLSAFRAEAPSEVHAEAPGLTLDAGAMAVSEDEVIRFTGGVRVLYEPRP